VLYVFLQLLVRKQTVKTLRIKLYQKPQRQHSNFSGQFSQLLAKVVLQVT